MKANTVPRPEAPVRGKLISLEDAADKLGMSKQWLYLRMREGSLPFAWFMPSPGKRLIDSADIDDYLRVIKIPVASKFKTNARRRHVEK
jgi:hypothetical protein